ncbi:MAG: YwmB family TATA-box binding protein [Clostridia bacterium]|nr:YwmB family TATA-box binding protein [Clostridia bacterium]
MFFWRLKRTVAATLAAILAVAVFALVRVGSVSKFATYAGIRTYYLDSASSQGLQKQTLSGLEFLRVKGESVYVADADETFAQEILREYGATVLWTETVSDVTSYYCYTPIWQDGVCINGKTVNLHIAVGETYCVIGSPIIFGGY